MISRETNCPSCGAALSHALQGLCPHCLWGDSVAEEDDGLLPGYTMGAELARGGMGIVYAARQLSPQREVAVKMLRPHLLEQAAMKERFRQEAQAAAALQHPGILPVYQVGETDGVPWFTMMLAEGGTLSARRERYHGRWRDTAQLMAHLSRAVGHAHERGVLHRDLKPGNILFDAAGRAYVCDFGLAKVATAGETTPDWTLSVQLLGTPHYMPPEIAGGTLKQAHTSGDIYSLGVILYELLAGHLPFDAENVPALLRKIADEEPLTPSVRPPVRKPPVARRSETARNDPASAGTSLSTEALRAPVGVLPDGRGCNPVSERRATGGPATGAPPADLAAIAMKCLEKSPARRYATAAALADDLESWLAGKAVSARRLSSLQKAGHWVRRNPAIAMLGGLLALSVIAGVLYGWRRQIDLERAVAETLQSEASLQIAFANTRLSEANYRRSGSEPGRQIEVCKRIASCVGYSDAAEIRTALAAALAVSDLTLEQRWRWGSIGGVTGWASGNIPFTSDFSRCVLPTAQIIDMSARQRIKRLAGEIMGHLEFSPDDRWMAFAIWRGAVEVHDLSDRGRAPIIVHSSPNTSEAWKPSFSQDGTRCLVATDATHAKIVSLPDGGLTDVAWEVPPMPQATNAVEQQPVRVLATAWSPDGACLALVWPRVFQIVRLADLGVVHESSHSQLLEAHVAWAPDGGRVVFCDQRGILCLLDMKTETISYLPTLHRQILAITFSPDGRQIATVGRDDKLAITDVYSKAGIPLRRPAVEGALRFSRDGVRLVFSPNGAYGAIHRLVPAPAFRHWAVSEDDDHSLSDVCISPDGRWLAAAQASCIRFYDTAAGREVAAYKLPVGSSGPIRSVHFSGSGDYTIIGVERGDSHGIMSIPFAIMDGIPHTGKPIPLNSDPTTRFEVKSISGDGKSLIVATTPMSNQTGSNDRYEISIWPDCDAARARVLIAATTGVNSQFGLIPGTTFAFSRGFKFDGISIWSLETGGLLHTLPAEHSSADVSRDGKFMVCAIPGGYGIFDTAGWQMRASWKYSGINRTDWLGPRFTPDGRLILLPAGSRSEGRLELRSAIDGRLVASLIPPAPISPSVIAFSPDSRRIYMVTYSGLIAEWNMGHIRDEWSRIGVPESAK